MSYLDWEEEETFEPRTRRLLYVVTYGNIEYTLELLTQPASSFPFSSYSPDPEKWILRYWLESKDLCENQISFENRQPVLLQHVQAAKTWAEEKMLTPMDRLNLHLNETKS